MGSKDRTEVMQSGGISKRVLLTDDSLMNRSPVDRTVKFESCKKRRMGCKHTKEFYTQLLLNRRRLQNLEHDRHMYGLAQHLSPAWF